MRGNGIGYRNVPTTTAASGVWSLNEQYRSQRSDTWPGLGIVTSGLVINIDAGNVASYPGTGTTWTDLSGSGNNFLLYNASAWRSGTTPYMDFEGSYSWAYTANSTDITATSNATIMMFSSIKNSTGDWRTLMRGSTSNGQHQVIIESGSNRLGMYDQSYGFRPSGFDISTLPSPYTKFNCLTWRMSTSSPYYRFSYNANPTTYDITAGGPWTGFTHLGAYQGGSQFWGKIAVYLLYNRTLTDGEITRNFNAYKARFSL